MKKQTPGLRFLANPRPRDLIAGCLSKGQGPREKGEKPRKKPAPGAGYSGGARGTGGSKKSRAFVFVFS
jgi:hypothetical protein